jgi:hypothetical protein
LSKICFSRIINIFINPITISITIIITITITIVVIAVAIANKIAFNADAVLKCIMAFVKTMHQSMLQQESFIFLHHIPVPFRLVRGQGARVERNDGF